MNEELKFKEDAFVLKLKVAVLFILNVIGAATGAYAHFVKPFSGTKVLTFVGSSVYLLGLGFLTLLLQFNYIRPTIYRGSSKSGTVWMESTLIYPQGIYSLQVKGFGAQAQEKAKSFSLQIPVGSWITEAGEIVPEAVYSLLQKELIF
jgi:hypothetical protein